jgi:hypothetical protein
VTFSEADWQTLGVPIRLAFFVRDDDRALGGRAVYPSAAGPVSSPLGPDAFELLEGKVARGLELLPRVEAMLVRAGPTGDRAYRAPIDVCYRLVGLLRARSDAPNTIDRFFSDLDERCGRANVA